MQIDELCRPVKAFADCANTRSTAGRNATPIAIIEAAHKVLDPIVLDPASDVQINGQVQARSYWGISADGFKLLQDKNWSFLSAWLNPPGKTVTGGTSEQRLSWVANHQRPDYVKPKELRVIKAADWFKALYAAYKDCRIGSAIMLCYRGGSMGSLGAEILQHPICITCAGAKSEAINGSGRLSYEIVNDVGDRIPETSNTQSSTLVYLGASPEKFKKHFEQFGVVKI